MRQVQRCKDGREATIRLSASLAKEAVSDAMTFNTISKD